MLTVNSPYRLVSGENPLDATVVYTNELSGSNRQKKQLGVPEQQSEIDRLFCTNPESPDKLEVMIESARWEYFGSSVNIGVY